MITIRNNDPAYRNAPVGLTAESALEPFSVLKWFFYPSDTLPEYRKWLEKYIVAAIEKKNKWNRNKLVRCIYRFRQIASLMDALWLIYEKGEYGHYKELTTKRGGIDQPYVRWSDKMYDVMQSRGFEEAEFTMYKLPLTKNRIRLA